MSSKDSKIFPTGFNNGSFVRILADHNNRYQPVTKNPDLIYGLIGFKVGSQYGSCRIIYVPTKEWRRYFHSGYTSSGWWVDRIYHRSKIVGQIDPTVESVIDDWNCLRTILMCNNNNAIKLRRAIFKTKGLRWPSKLKMKYPVREAPYFLPKINNNPIWNAQAVPALFQIWAPAHAVQGHWLVHEEVGGVGQNVAG